MLNSVSKLLSDVEMGVGVELETIYVEYHQSFDEDVLYIIGVFEEGSDN